MGARALHGHTDAVSETAPRCPHCGAVLAAERAGPVRCGSCRLIVGAGRAVAGGVPSGRGVVGTASSFAASRARREAVGPVDPARVVAALREVAGRHAVRVQSLRMIDYRQAVAQGHEGPTLAQVMATFGSWQAARAAAEAT